MVVQQATPFAFKSGLIRPKRASTATSMGTFQETGKKEVSGKVQCFSIVSPEVV
jgi:hypothetical protein